MKFASFVLPCLLIFVLVFSMPQLSFSAQPGLHVVDWNTFTWTYNSASPTTELDHWVQVIDYDGIADDGGSHTVMVTYPDLSTDTLWFNYKKNDHAAVYSLWDNSIPQPIDPATYTGNYVYRVTDVGTGEWSEMTDYINFDPVNPPDETSFSPGYGAPQSIIAHFDNVYTNGSLYDDFESGFDPSKWDWQPQEIVSNETQVVAPGTITVDGNGADWAGLTPALVDPQGDSSGGVGADIKHVFTAMDDTYAYVMMETYNQPIHPDAGIEINFNYKAWQHWLGKLHDDLHVDIGSSTLSACNDNDLDGNNDPYPISGYTVVRGNVMEAKIPLSEIENAGYFNPTFVNIWTDTAPPGEGDDASTVVPTIAGEVHFERTWNNESGSPRMKLVNPETINELKATVRVESISGDKPYARIGGTFCHDSVGEITARAGIRENEAVYVVNQEYWDGGHFICNSLVPMASLGPVSQGNRYDISLDWDEPTATLTFRVIGLDDSVNYEAPYTVSGPISPADNSQRFIGLSSWLILDTTTPTFDWDEISGASLYRVRTYSWNDNTICRGYVKSPPYTVPPGILKPNGLYKYRIEARKGPQWFEADNVAGSDRNKAQFIAGPDEAEDPYVDLWSTGVNTWTNDTIFGTHTSFYIRINDAQGVPGNIDSVKVLLPDDSTAVNLYLDYNDSSTCGIYRGHYFGTIQSGEYTFTVVDKDRNSHSKAEILTSDPINPPSEASLQPANNTVIGGTVVNFDWDDVSGAAFYELKLYDKDLNYQFTVKTTESEFTFPPGILEENSQYRYKIDTRREFFEDNSDNGCSVPEGAWIANTFFTTETYGGALPILNLDSFGVDVCQEPHPATGDPIYELEFSAMVTDSDGVPENIERVEVTYPDKTTTRLLRYLDSPDHGLNYFSLEYYSDPSLIQNGIYTFKVVDFDDHEVTLQDTLTDVVSNILPWPTNVSPADGTILNNTTPTITWDTVSGASYYKVRIMSSWAHPTIHWSSELTQTQYTVPMGVLEPNTTYGYRVYAYRESIGSEVDFYSCNHSWHSTNYHFTTGGICEGDFNGDGDVDGSDLATFAADFGRTDCGTGEDCEGDFDHDGDVDGSDLAVFAADFGRTDCPRELRMTVIDEFSFSPGSPHGLAFDGNYLWCVANGEDKIYKLNTDGSVESSISSPGSSPTGLTFDGTYLWNSDDNSLEIYQLDTSGSMLSSFNAPGGDSTGLAFDGTYLWNADFASGGKIHKINTSGTLVESFDSPDNGPEGLAYDGTYLWNVDINKNKIYKLDMSGNVINSCSSPGGRPIGLTFDGTYFWLADQGLSKIFKLSIE